MRTDPDIVDSGLYPRTASFLASADGTQALIALEKALEACERAHGANYPLTRERAWNDAAEAAANLLEATGVAQQIRRQMAAHALGDSTRDTPSDSSFADLVRPEMTHTATGRMILRDMAARLLLSLSKLAGGKFGAALAGTFGAMNKGFASFWQPEQRPGASKDGAPADFLRVKIVGMTGYTVKAKRQQLNRALLAKAADRFNVEAAQRGLPELVVRPKTVRDWCMRSHAKEYKTSCRNGANDARLGTVDPALIL